jgi:hypothetical protein
MTFYASTPPPAGVNRRPSKLAPANRLQRPSQPDTYSTGPKTHSPQSSISSSPPQQYTQHAPTSPKGTHLAPPNKSSNSSPSSSRSSSTSPSPGRGRQAALPPLHEDFPSALASGKPKLSPARGEGEGAVPSILRPGKPNTSPGPRPRVASTQGPPPQHPSSRPFSPIATSPAPYQPVTGNEARLSSTTPVSAPYPPAHSTLYPPVNSNPYPQSNSSPYPPPNQSSYPPTNQSTYRPGSAAPYPATNTSPYSSNTPQYRPAPSTYSPPGAYEPGPPVSFPMPLAAPASYDTPAPNPSYQQSYKPQQPPAQASDFPDPYLSARYQAPLPLPGSPPQRHAPVKHAPVTSSASAKVLDEAARRKHQEEEDLALARKLDRELNMQELEDARAGRTGGGRNSMPGGW